MRRTVTALRYFGAAVTFLLRRFALHAKETTIPSRGAVCARLSWKSSGSTSKEKEREIIPRAINFRGNVFLNVFYCTIYLETGLRLGEKIFETIPKIETNFRPDE